MLIRTALFGWSKVHHSRIGRCPSGFDISATRDSPVYAVAAGIYQGQTCTVTLGGDRVVTGYVDTLQPRYDAND